MKTLYLVRHANASDKNNPNIKDFDRELSKKGIKDIKKVSKKLLKKQVNPDIIITSPSTRTIQTCKIIRKKLNIPKSKIKKEKSVYDEDTYKNFYKLLENIPNDIKSVMFIGHNPPISDFLNDLIGKDDKVMDTSEVNCVELNTDKWKDIKKSEQKLSFTLIPNEI